MAKRTKTGRSGGATSNRQRQRIKSAVETGKGAARRTVGAIRIKASHASRPGKQAIERTRKQVAKTARKIKSSKPKLRV